MSRPPTWPGSTSANWVWINPAAHFEAHGLGPVRWRRFWRAGLAAAQLRLLRAAPWTRRWPFRHGLQARHEFIHAEPVPAARRWLARQSVATGSGDRIFPAQGAEPLARRSWLVLAIASLIFALQHGYRSNWRSAPGSTICARRRLPPASLLFALGVYGFRRLA
jgi:hypothetical protein